VNNITLWRSPVGPVLLWMMRSSCSKTLSAIWNVARMLWEAASGDQKEIGFTILSMTISLVAVFIPVLFMAGMPQKREVFFEQAPLKRMNRQRLRGGSPWFPRRPSCSSLQCDGNRPDGKVTLPGTPPVREREDVKIARRAMEWTGDPSVPRGRSTSSPAERKEDFYCESVGSGPELILSMNHGKLGHPSRD